MAIKVEYDDYRGTKTYKNIEDILFENLILRQCDFNKLTQKYIRYLQTLEDDFKKQLSEVDFPLISYIEKGKLSDKDKSIKDACIRYLVKYERFKTAPVGNKLEEYVKDNNINIKGEYMNDLYLEREKNND